MSIEGRNELDIRGIYDALPSTLKLRDPPLEVTKSHYFRANTTRNAAGTDMFEVDVAYPGPRPHNTHMDVKDVTTAKHRALEQKCFSVSGKYSQKNIYPLIPFFNDKSQELGLREEIYPALGDIAFRAFCPYDEITPPNRAVPSIKQAFIDVATLWKQLREYAVNNTNPIKIGGEKATA